MPRPLDGHGILVIEDEPLVAVELAEVLERAGASVLTTTSLQHAAVAVERPGIDGAIVDQDFKDGGAAALCSRLDELGIPFVLYRQTTARDDKVGKRADEQLLAAMVDLISRRRPRGGVAH